MHVNFLRYLSEHFAHKQVITLSTDGHKESPAPLLEPGRSFISIISLYHAVSSSTHPNPTALANSVRALGPRSDVSRLRALQD